MRALLLMAAGVAALLWTPAASAAQIVENLPAIETLGDFTPFDIAGAALFDPALGTLTSVTGELTGIVTPENSVDLGPFPTSLATGWWVATLDTACAVVETHSGSLPDQIVTPVVSGGPYAVATYTGSPTPVDLTFHFANLANFIGNPSPPSPCLLDFGFRSDVGDLGHMSSGSDLTTFQGNFALIYTYAAAADPIPEPDTLLSLGVGVLTLMGLGFLMHLSSILRRSKEPLPAAIKSGGQRPASLRTRRPHCASPALNFWASLAGGLANPTRSMMLGSLVSRGDAPLPRRLGQRIRHDTARSHSSPTADGSRCDTAASSSRRRALSGC
jgi:hypothetical protein